MRALVTGANGALGPSLVRHLIETGWTVDILLRQPDSETFEETSVNVHVGDITSLMSISDAFQGIDIVFHLAALLHNLDSTNKMAEAYHLVNVVGTENVMTAARQANVQRVILFSTIAAYGDHSPLVITEDTEPHPRTEYGKTKLAAEKVVLSPYDDNGGPQGVVLRLGATYGTRIKGNYCRLLHSLDKGHFIPIGHGENRRTLIYDRDVALSASIAAVHPAASGNIFNVTDGHLYTVGEIINAMCQALDRPPPRFSIPAGPARKAAGIFEDLLRFFSQKSPISRATIDKYTEDVAVDGRLIQEKLGFSPQYDLVTGWRETVEEMRKSGDL